VGNYLQWKSQLWKVGNSNWLFRCVCHKILLPTRHGILEVLLEESHNSKSMTQLCKGETQGHSKHCGENGERWGMTSGVNVRLFKGIGKCKRFVLKDNEHNMLAVHY
jgi:hypothetical protein